MKKRQALLTLLAHTHVLTEEKRAILMSSVNDFTDEQVDVLGEQLAIIAENRLAQFDETIEKFQKCCDQLSYSLKKHHGKDK